MKALEFGIEVGDNIGLAPGVATTYTFWARGRLRTISEVLRLQADKYFNNKTIKS